MNTRRVLVTALSCIVLAFIIKGYCVFQQVGSVTDASFDCATETLKSFLYLAVVFVAVIIAPFVFKIKV
jgi:hypothetical protein